MVDTYYTARQRQLRAKVDANERKVRNLSRQERNLKNDIEKRRSMLAGAIERQYEFDIKRRNAISRGRSHKSYDQKLRSQTARAGKYVGQIRRDEEKLQRIQFKRSQLEQERKVTVRQMGYRRQKVRFILAVEYKEADTRHVEVEVIVDATAEYLGTISQMPFKIAEVYLNRFYGQKLVSIARSKGQLGSHRYPPHEEYYAPDSSIKMEISYMDYDNRKNDRSFPETEVTSMQGALESAKRIADGAR
jgi:vacuolar-type H+-ATPase subunit I/STV1